MRACVRACVCVCVHSRAEACAKEQILLQGEKKCVLDTRQVCVCVCCGGGKETSAAPARVGGPANNSFFWVWWWPVYGAGVGDSDGCADVPKQSACACVRMCACAWVSMCMHVCVCVCVCGCTFSSLLARQRQSDDLPKLRNVLN